jgi:tetratricopeptide (TPR) repeat protein
VRLVLDDCKDYSAHQRRQHSTIGDVSPAVFGCQTPSAFANERCALIPQIDRAAARRSAIYSPDPEAHNNLANLLARHHAYAEAAYHFEAALRSDPTYAEAHHSYGLVLALMRSYTKAVAALQEAVRLSPGSARPHTDLGDVLAITGRVDQAAREYELAIQANPREYEAHYGLGEIMARQRRTSEAVAHFQAAAQSSDPALRDAARTRLEALR